MWSARRVEVDVRKDCLRPEHNSVVVGIHTNCVDLLYEVGDVVAQSEEVLFVLGRTGLAGHRQLSQLVMVAQGAKALSSRGFNYQNLVAQSARENIKRT